MLPGAQGSARLLQPVGRHPPVSRGGPGSCIDLKHHLSLTNLHFDCDTILLPAAEAANHQRPQLPSAPSPHKEQLARAPPAAPTQPPQVAHGASRLTGFPTPFVRQICLFFRTASRRPEAATDLRSAGNRAERRDPPQRRAHARRPPRGRARRRWPVTRM